MSEKRILVSGLVNVETSVKVDVFPIDYCPISYPFFGVSSCVSGVGFNVAKALKTLGSKVDLYSLLGEDGNLPFIEGELIKSGLSIRKCLIREKKENAQSVALVDNNGKRRIYCDLKDLQDCIQNSENTLDLKPFSLLVATNINFSRPLLKEAKRLGITIASDVHVLSDIHDSYNAEFISSSDILFLSNEAILGVEGDFVRKIYQEYHNPIIVCGCGPEGALLYLGQEDEFVHEPALAPKGVVSTIGAGDALFSCFLHFYNKGLNPKVCLRLAVLFAGLKISSSGGSNGFVSEEELLKDAL